MTRLQESERRAKLLQIITSGKSPVAKLEELNDLISSYAASQRLEGESSEVLRLINWRMRMTTDVVPSYLIDEYADGRLASLHTPQEAERKGRESELKTEIRTLEDFENSIDRVLSGTNQEFTYSYFTYAIRQAIEIRDNRLATLTAEEGKDE